MTEIGPEPSPEPRPEATVETDTIADVPPEFTHGGAVTTDAAEEAPAEPEPEPERPGASRTVVRSLAVLVLVFFAGTVAMAVVAAREHGRLSRTTNNRQAAEQVASRMAAALVTFDYTKLAQTRTRVLSLATGKFRNEYDQAFKGGLDVLLTKTQARSTGVVKDVFVNGIQNDNATAIVILDQTVEGLSGTRRQLDAYVQLTLVKVRGQWKVDDVVNLNFGQTTGATPVPGAATSPTTVAPPPSTAPPK